MSTLFMILVTLVTLTILVSIHEYGHYWVARRCGVKVLRFSIGFGKPLWSKTNAEGVEFVVAPIPLGGYVKMLDEREAEVPAELRNQAFNRQSPMKRIAIAAAGPLANILLAIFVYWLLFLQGTSSAIPLVGEVLPDTPAARAEIRVGDEIVAIGGKSVGSRDDLHLALVDLIGETRQLSLSVKPEGSESVTELELQLDNWLRGEVEPDVLAGFGIAFWQPPIPAVIDQVLPGSPAERAGMLSGDSVVEVDGQWIEDWPAWVEYVRERPGRELIITVDRGSETVDLSLTPERKVDEQGKAHGYAGVSVLVPEWPEDMLRLKEYGPVAALVAAGQKTGQMVTVTLNALKKLLTGLLSPRNLSGPISIAKVAGTSAQYGFPVWLGFLAFFSVNLAVLNLLPIPVLDGGHICYALFEQLTGKPVTEAFQGWANQIGMALVLAVMVMAVYNDILRL